MSSTSASQKKPMNPEESYTQRRELFKNIWKTAMVVGPNTDIMTKPKLIKTLRIDELDQCPIGKSKKERIKNLRHVCNKILDFCDKQDADDAYYQGVSTVDDAAQISVHKSNKTKVRHRKKVNKPKGIFPDNTQVTVAQYTTGTAPTAHNKVVTVPLDTRAKTRPTIKSITATAIANKRQRSELNDTIHGISNETRSPPKKHMKNKLKKKKPSHAS